MPSATNLFLIFIGGYVSVFVKPFLNNKGQFYSHLIIQNMFLIGRNVFLVATKQFSCAGAKTNICEGLRTYFP